MRKQKWRRSRIEKVNKATKPSAKQLKVRGKRPPKRCPASRRACAGVKKWRKGLDLEGRQIRSAIEQACQHYRNAVRGYKKPTLRRREPLGSGAACMGEYQHGDCEQFGGELCEATEEVHSVQRGHNNDEDVSGRERTVNSV